MGLNTFLMFISPGLGLDASSDGCLTAYPMISRQSFGKCFLLPDQPLPPCNVSSVVWLGHLETQTVSTNLSLHDWLRIWVVLTVMGEAAIKHFTDEGLRQRHSDPFLRHIACHPDSSMLLRPTEASGFSHCPSEFLVGIPFFNPAFLLI